MVTKSNMILYNTRNMILNLFIFLGLYTSQIPRVEFPNQRHASTPPKYRRYTETPEIEETQGFSIPCTRGLFGPRLWTEKFKVWVGCCES